MSTPSLTRWDALKFIALLLMFVDHAGAFYFLDEQWLRGVGRACAPIFLFLAGFAPHYKFDRMLVVLAAALTVSDWLVTGAPNTLNILWNIIVVRMILAWLESRGKYKLRLHEWFIASVPFLSLLAIIHYGPFGLLFGLCGYAFKHRAQYDARTPLRFLLITTLYYAVIYAWFSEFTWVVTLAMIAVLVPMVWLILWFTRAPLAPCPAPFSNLLKICARQSGVIYAVHLMILGWLTGLSI